MSWTEEGGERRYRGTARAGLTWISGRHNGTEV